MDIADAISSSSCLLQEITFVGCERTVNWHWPLTHALTLSRFRVSHGARFATIGQSEDDSVNRLRLVHALEALDTNSLYMFLVQKEWSLGDHVSEYAVDDSSERNFYSSTWAWFQWLFRWLFP